MTCGGRALRGLTHAGRTVFRRSFASAPEPAPEVPVPEALRLTASAPLLLKLPERTWGAATALPGSLVSNLIGVGATDRVAVARHAFAAHAEAEAPLSEHLARISEGSVAVAHSITEPHQRLIVDEYVASADGQFRLDRVGTDLLRFLAREGVRVSHVPDVAVAAATGHNSTRAAASGVRQSTNEVFMVAPTAFGFNDQAAQDNHFMHSRSSGGASAAPGGSITQRVLREFAALHHELTEVAGVRVSLFQHSLRHGTPDAVFPNNWFTTHPAGEARGGVQRSTLALYPLKCPNRRAERREDAVAMLRARGYGMEVDLSPAEREGTFLEGTGVLVLDRINGVAYVCLSDRADAALAQSWVDQLGYRELVMFTSTDAKGFPVYHTNVMMAIGTDVAVVCAESVPDDKERAHLLAALRRHHQVVEITRAQMGEMCGNILELEDGRGLPVLAMSSRAHAAFGDDHRRTLRRHVAALHHAPIPTIEHVGGGGVRCALGELF